VEGGLEEELEKEWLEKEQHYKLVYVEDRQVFNY
jgi:hypothetical protein